LAGQSSAKPESANGDFLSWGRGFKVRASVKTKFIPPFARPKMILAAAVFIALCEIINWLLL
jgi:hypothetical protein